MEKTRRFPAVTFEGSLGEQVALPILVVVATWTSVMTACVFGASNKDAQIARVRSSDIVVSLVIIMVPGRDEPGN